jgi:hypothetical protein
MCVERPPETDAGATRATMNYLARSARPVIYSAGPGAPETRIGDRVHPRVVILHDARRIASTLSIDRQGFRLLGGGTNVDDFFDDSQLRAVYLRQVEDIVQSETGACRVVVFDPARRTSVAETRKPGVGGPVLRVHNDFSDRSARQIVRDLLPNEAPRLLQRRFAIVQLWRPMRRAVESFPLAIADSRTIAAEDLVAVRRRYPDWEGESHLVTYRPRHHWYWVPHMQPGETLVFKGYDSCLSGPARWGVHTAFEPAWHGTLDDVPPRESIEIRALAFFASN